MRQVSGRSELLKPQKVTHSNPYAPQVRFKVACNWGVYGWAIVDRYEYNGIYFVPAIFFFCSSNVNLTGVNSNVIMSGCADDNPDDARREAARDNSKSI